MSKELEKILVLASNSFTGSHFIDYLLKDTKIQICGISRSSEYNPVFLPYLYKKEKPERFRFFQIDLNTQFAEFCKVCEEFAPDVVVNFAAQGEVRNSWKWPEQWYQTNCLGVVKVAEFLKDKKYLKKYIAASTPEVYGATGLNIKESYVCNPSTPYAASKLAGDLHLFTLFKRSKFPVVFTRAANLYGIHQQLYRIIPRTIIFLRLGKKIELHGRGLARRAFIHARDVADLTWRAITKGKTGEIFHVAPEGDLRSVAEVVHFICDQLGYDFDRSVQLIDENFGQDSLFSLDAAKARGELGWKPQVSFENGVTEMICWIDENWEFIKSQPLDYVHKI